MKKNKIKGLRVFSSALLSGALVLGLTTCSNKENQVIEEYKIENSFNDHNTTGIDDDYENIVEDSQINIEELKKIEKIIDLIPKMEKHDIINHDNINNIEEHTEISEDEIGVVDSIIEEINEDNSLIDANDNKQFLNEEYYKMKNYLLKQAPEYLKKSELEIAKTVCAATNNLDSIDRVKAYIDVNHLTYSGNGRGWYEYYDGNGRNIVRFETNSSKIFDLVEDYINYDNLDTNEENFEDLINMYKKSLITIVKTVNNDYEEVDELFQKNPILKVKK